MVGGDGGLSGSGCGAGIGAEATKLTAMARSGESSRRTGGLFRRQRGARRRSQALPWGVVIQRGGGLGSGKQRDLALVTLLSRRRGWRK